MRMASLSASNARIQVRPTILYIVLLQLAVSVAATSSNEVADAIIVQKKGRLEQREFDYLVLALQWPGTICRGTRRCCSSNACCHRSGAFADFTIHGLWPDYNDGSWPSCCTQSDFDVDKIRTLLDTMKKYWPSLSCNSPSTCHGKRGSFWAHEWEKHGTCSYPIARDEYGYFLTALTMYFRYNVTEVLNDAGFVPSNTEKYPLGGIISAIENAFHATPLLVCSRGAVEELRLCFYKDLKPRDCVRTDSKNVLITSKFSCPRYVSLPAYDPEDWIFDGITSTNSSTRAHLSA